MTILQLLSVYYFNQYIINQKEECWVQLESVAFAHYLEDYSHFIKSII